jgi:hypothetical protein
MATLFKRLLVRIYGTLRRIDLSRVLWGSQCRVCLFQVDVIYERSILRPIGLCHMAYTRDRTKSFPSEKRRARTVTMLFNDPTNPGQRNEEARQGYFGTWQHCDLDIKEREYDRRAKPCSDLAARDF